MGPPTPAVRFDDPNSPETSVVLSEFRYALEARQPDEVQAMLDSAQRAAGDGAWVAGFVAYEAAPAFDPALAVARPTGGLPLAWFGVFGRADPAAALPATTGGAGTAWRLSWTAEKHADAVAVVKGYLAAGDSYQVNLTVRAEAHVEDPESLYASMLRRQAGTFGAYVDTGEWAVVCASPELLFESDGDRIMTRPMKGTIGRGRYPAEDRHRRDELAGSAKDGAEHVMIVDLVRNDLGRVCRPGTVRVESFEDIERYPTVWQMTSTVSGLARPGCGLVDAFRALFPCGSVTGAPKMRTMGIIRDVEERPRGVYCGAVGYIAAGGAASRFAVAIRTATVDKTSGWAVYGSGGGIVWDSDPATEWAEVRAKCSILQPVDAPPGLLETLRFEPPDCYVNLDGHLRRMQSSAEYFGLPFDRDEVEASVHAGCDGLTEVHRIRMLLRPGRQLDVEVSAMPAPPAIGRPLRLAFACERIDSNDPAVFHKSIDRSRYEALRATRSDVDDVVICNERDEVTETAIANLAVCFGGKWWTPALDCGLLPGVERQRLLDRGALAEAVISRDRLPDAEQIAVVSSLRGWRAAVLVQ